MAKGLRRCLGVDLGSHSIKVADLSLAKTDMVVNKLVSAELELTPGMAEADREALTARTLRDLLKRNKITCRDAVFSIPGQQVFIRSIRVPRTSEERLRRIVNYEADQLIPFGPDQSLRRYQVDGVKDSDECEVLLAAVKREHIDRFMRVVGKTGLKPVCITVGRLALHDYYRFISRPFISPEERKRLEKEGEKEAKRKAAEEKKRSGRKKEGVKEKTPVAEKAAGAPEAGKKAKKFSFSLSALFSKKGRKAPAEEAQRPELESPEQASEEEVAAREEAFQEVIAAVNIGARTMDLSIPKFSGGNALGFSRSVPLGGDEMTLAVQREKGLESFAEAERVKRAHAAVVDRELGAEDIDPGVDVRASTAVTKVVDRLIIELRRSLDYFISQPDGVAVDAIALSGGPAALPNMREYVEERLGIPVKITAEIESQNLTLAEGVTPSPSTFLIAIGSALLGLGYGEVTVDFLPDELQVVRALKQKSLVLFLMIGAVAGSVAMSTTIGREGAARYRRATWDIEEVSAKGKDWGPRYDAANNERKALEAKFAAVSRAYSNINRDYWFAVLLYIQQCKPTDIVIATMNLGGLGKVQIAGYAEEYASAGTFVKNLKANAALVPKANLLKSDPVQSPLYQSRQVFYFRIEAYFTRLARIVTPLPWSAERTPEPGREAATEEEGGEAEATPAATPSLVRPRSY